ncbi:unnamed protein product [Cuscuta epithymum]|uniref:Elongin-A n=1 Tax=Cuscuta epithymum TaxID=186058 RepID=A0AAV0GJL3_9ASTE|nr:unnamed protein product [Cuscuta epithymum]CAH9147929.1 unnamed protein product [Cuscuta epithymum]
MGSMRVNRNVPSLVDLCVQFAICHVRHLHDVGETDYHLLDRILPHCTIDELACIERSTEGRDLSPVTNKLWKKFYEREFGEKSTNQVVEKMKQKRCTFKWRQLYEAKLKVEEEVTQQSFERIKDLYKKQETEKQNRQIKICTKIPPSSCKRNFYGGGSGVYNTKSTVMKKAKMDYMRSPEYKNLAAIKSKAVQRTNSSVFSPKKLGGPSVMMAAPSPPKLMRPAEKVAMKPMKNPAGKEAITPMRRPADREAWRPMMKPAEREAPKLMKKPAEKRF